MTDSPDLLAAARAALDRLRSRTDQLDGTDLSLSEVSAVSEQGRRQLVLSWVQERVEDPNADNIVFKYAGALRDFGQHDRAERFYEQLPEYAASAPESVWPGIEKPR